MGFEIEGDKNPHLRPLLQQKEESRRCTVALLAVSEEKEVKSGISRGRKWDKNRSSQSFAIGFSTILSPPEHVLFNDICH